MIKMFAVFSCYVNLQSIYKMLQAIKKVAENMGGKVKNMFWPKFYHAWYANAQI
jgi:FtsZ-interacting cell division protein ZipA